MIEILKNCKTLSLANITIILLYIVFPISTKILIVLLMGTYLLFMVYGLYKLSIRSNISKKELNTIDKYLRYKYDFENYKSFYKDSADPYGDFHLELVEYALFLKSLCKSLLRMDKRLIIIDMDYINKGLELIEKYNKKNENIKKDYDITNSVVKILNKYYDDKGIRIKKLNIDKTTKLFLLILTLIILFIMILGILMNSIKLYLVLSVLIFACELLLVYLIKKKEI
jgi:hypothetical protein